MSLTDPGTRSPGRLAIGYQTAAIEHRSACWGIHGLDLDSSLTLIRGDANVFATALMACCPNTSFAHTWYILNPDGVELYSENFEAAIVGSATPPDPSYTSQSIEITATGKGTPPLITTALGVTRTSVFTGYLAVAFELSKDFVVAPDGVGWTLLQFLRESVRWGCDRFGQKATYSTRMLVQINAHYQRQYGL